MQAEVLLWTEASLIHSSDRYEERALSLPLSLSAASQTRACWDHMLRLSLVSELCIVKRMHSSACPWR